MKVLLFANGLRSGGKERQVMEIAKGLSVKKEIEIVLVIMNSEIFYDDIHKINIPIEILERGNRSMITVMYNLYKLCKKYRPDIIHTWDYLSTFYSTFIVKMMNIKLINGAIRNAEYNFIPFGKMWLMTKLIYRWPDMIIANTRSGLMSLNLENKGIYIYNGFDESRIGNLVEPDIIRSRFNIKEKIIVGMVAKFKPDKDYESFIEAAKIVLLKFNNIAFVLVGEGPNLSKVKNSVKEIPNFKFLGQQNNIENIINIFDIGVMSSFTEGISNSIMEYMALGKPVIATNLNGTKEIVISEETGYLVNQKKPLEIADKIIFLLNNPKIGKMMGRRGQSRIREDFSLSKMTESYYELYCEILEK
jgi:glycosyltransferase involved in cell wall biosynthesis